jgi:E3 SUMO-protein ligase PIAS1
MASHRNTVSLAVRVQENPILQQCSTDPSLRVMVFCAGGNTGAQDICFPYQSELKVNGQEVKANLRGLKNKPGSTKPVDITDLLRFKPATYNNNVEFTYALTNKAGGRSEMSFIDRIKHVRSLCVFSQMQC